MHIDIFHDTVCPWCRIGKKNLADALKQLPEIEVTVRMRPFYLDAHMPPEGKPFRAHLAEKFGQAEKLQPMFEQVQKAGEAAGLVFRFDNIEIAPNTSLSHQWILAAEDRQLDLSDAIYKAYFEDGRDIGDSDTLYAIAREQGLNAAALKQKVNTIKMQKQLGEDLAYAHRIGLSGVPFFLIDGKYGITGARPASSLAQSIEQINEKKQS